MLHILHLHISTKQTDDTKVKMDIEELTEHIISMKS